MRITKELKTQLFAVAIQIITGQLRDLNALHVTLTILLTAIEHEMEAQRNATNR